MCTINTGWRELANKNVQRRSELIFKRLDFDHKRVQAIFNNPLSIFAEIIFYIYTI